MATNGRRPPGSACLTWASHTSSSCPMGPQRVGCAAFSRHDSRGKGKLFLPAQQVGWSVEGAARVQRHMALIVPPLFQLLLQNFRWAGPTVLQPLLALVVHFITDSWQEAALQAVTSLQEGLLLLAPILGADGWDDVLHALEQALLAESAFDLSSRCFFGGRWMWVNVYRAHKKIQNPCHRLLEKDEEEALGYALPPGMTLADAIRCRCNTVLLLQRVCDCLLSDCASWMPRPARLRLLAVLQVRMDVADCFTWYSTTPLSL